MVYFFLMFYIAEIHANSYHFTIPFYQILLIVSLVYLIIYLFVVLYLYHNISIEDFLDRSKINEMQTGVRRVSELIKDLTTGEMARAPYSALLRRVLNVDLGSHANLCLVCCRVQANTVMLPCRHSGLCRACCMSVMERNQRCPQCRTAVEKVLVGERGESNRDFRVVEELAFTRGTR